MAGSRYGRSRLTTKRGFKVAGGIAVAGFAVWAVVSTSRMAAAVGYDTVRVLWLMPALMILHAGQLLASAQAWRILLISSGPGCAGLGIVWLWRLRVMREGIDSLLPVAQIGGEVIAAQILARRGIATGQAAASVVVDVTLEFLSQLVFLLIGIAALAATSTGGTWQAWLGVAALTAVGGAGLLLVQRSGGLRLLEALSRAIAARWPALGASSLEGLHPAAAAIYGRSKPLFGAGALHLMAWLAGSLESWAVLRALDVPVSAGTALIVESLGMAARSAGFAIPGALVVQETGFVLAAAAAGVPDAVGLSLSLVKRVREVAIGLIGLGLWRLTPS